MVGKRREDNKTTGQDEGKKEEENLNEARQSDRIYRKVGKNERKRKKRRRTGLGDFRIVRG